MALSIPFVLAVRWTDFSNSVDKISNRPAKLRLWDTYMRDFSAIVWGEANIPVFHLSLYPVISLAIYIPLYSLYISLVIYG